jgi:hypothetical protein
MLFVFPHFSPKDWVKNSKHFQYLFTQNGKEDENFEFESKKAENVLSFSPVFSVEKGVKNN